MLKPLVSSLALFVAFAPSVTTAQTTVPVITPVSSEAVDAPFRAADEDLHQFGYAEAEYFVSGMANGAAHEGRPTTVVPYRTRILVRRPVDPAKFNGVVVVEWLNVSAGYELEMGWPMFSEELMRDGYAWVGVSAQPIGTGFLKHLRPSRYNSLTHPGLTTVPEPAPNGRTFLFDESWSFDIFKQVAAGIRGERGAKLFGKPPKTLIAFGGSQSEDRLVALMNRTQAADERPFDGYFLDVGLARDIPATPKVPVFLLNSEREVTDNYAYRRPDSSMFRYWEVAGAGHFSRLAQESAQRKALREMPALSGLNGKACGTRPGPVGTEYVSSAVIKHLTAWIQNGVEPPHAEPISVIKSAGAVQIARDRFGNALGGVRLPLVVVPTGWVLGRAAPPSVGLLCENISGFLPFPQRQIDLLYPSHFDYESKVRAASAAAVKAGYLLPADAESIIQEAERSEIGELRTPVLAPRGSWLP